LIGNEISLFLDLLFLNNSVDLEVAMSLGLFSNVGRKGDQKFRSSLNKHLRSSLWIQRVQKGQILALKVLRLIGSIVGIICIS
jgi:hypothetical protein